MSDYRKVLLVLIVLFLSVSTVSAVGNPNFTPIFDFPNDEVHYNQTTQLDPGTSTPWDLWILSGIIGLVIFCISLKAPSSPVEVEISAIYSVLAWPFIVFFAYTSFAVDRVIGYGVTGVIESQAANGAINTHEYVMMIQHQLYSFPIEGILGGIFFIIAILNTFRIVMLHNSFTTGG